MEPQLGRRSSRVRVALQFREVAVAVPGDSFVWPVYPQCSSLKSSKASQWFDERCTLSKEDQDPFHPGPWRARGSQDTNRMAHRVPLQSTVRVSCSLQPKPVRVD